MTSSTAKTVIIEEFGGSDAMKIVDREIGDPGPGQVRIRHKACGLNFIDVYQRTGLYPLDLPAALGMEAAGVIEAVGEGVTKFKPGDKVLSLFFPDWQKGEIDALGFGGVPGDGADGFAAELVAMPESAFTRMPEGYSYT